MIGSYMFNVWECGAVISFIHDFTDMFGHICKAASNTKCDWITIPSFFMVLLSWGYMRNIVFPICIWQLWNSGIFAELKYILPIYCYLLSCLVILHYYWYYIFMNVLKNLVFKGITEDLQNKIVVEEENKEVK